MKCECSNVTKKVTGDLMEMTAKHPCYSFDAHATFARMHLPVAPACNISCNYCNRKYDCVNESRPGVTSEVLMPEAAKEKFLRVREQVPNISVVGIAGPGDALANWSAVTKTIRLIQKQAPEVIFCISTNGLMLPHYAQEAAALGIKHVTVTMNSLSARRGAMIYRHIRYQGKYYFGEAAAEILIQNQMQGISMLAALGILVKVNIVMIDGINSEYIPLLVRKVKALGACMTNIMPLIPAPGSAFAEYAPTSKATVEIMRERCQLDLPQMRHCQQCRADAVGLLTKDRSAEFSSKAVDEGKKII